MINVCICVTSPSFSKNTILRNEVLKYFPVTKFNDSGQKLEGTDLINFAKGSAGIIVGLETMDSKIIKKMPNLKIISKYGVGLDNIDVNYCRKKSIPIGWTPGVNKTSVAEITIAFMVALSRNLYLTSNQLKSGRWNKNGGSDLTGKTIGIIGVGNVGKEVVRFLKPYNNKILVNDIIDQSEYYFKNDLKEEAKEKIYGESDFVTLHVPLNADTEGLVDKSVFRNMKKTAFLINTSRGRVINQDDLKWALKNGIIAGAAIDVYREEPPEDTDFLGLPNLINTPHIGGNSSESVLAMGRYAIKHLKDYFKK